VSIEAWNAWYPSFRFLPHLRASFRVSAAGTSFENFTTTLSPQFTVKRSRADGTWDVIKVAPASNLPYSTALARLRALGRLDLTQSGLPRCRPE
jgi:hypothetical protein